MNSLTEQILIYKYIYNLTNAKIAKMLNRSTRTVQNHLKKSRENGEINALKKISPFTPVFRGGGRIGCYGKNAKKGSININQLGNIYYRLHGLQIKFHPYNISKKYANYDKSKELMLGYTRVKLYRNSIVAYLNISFEDAEMDTCLELSNKYLLSIIAKLEYMFDLVILKHNYGGVTISKNHWARVNDQGAREVINQGKKLAVFSKDGKYRLLIDQSTGVPEAEAIHKNTAYDDMEAYTKELEFLLDHPEYSREWVTKHVLLLIKTQKESSKLLYRTITELEKIKKNK